MSIVISSSLAYDYVMNFPDSFKNHLMPDQLHILSVCFTVDRLTRSMGGVGGNIAYTMKLLGAEPLLVSTLGKDGQDYVDYLAQQGIATHYIQRDATRFTASAHITTDMDNNQITAFYNGPLDRGREFSMYDIKEKCSLALVAVTEKETMIRHLKECAERGIKAVFDPGQQITTFKEVELKKMIDQATVVIGNDYEIKLMEQTTGWTGKEILENTEILITTLGERGSIITTSDGEEIVITPCAPESVDDPTGAGDAYRAGFFVGYEKGLPLRVCGQMGSVAASYAVETAGTQGHHFTKEQFAARYTRTYGEGIKL